MAVDATTPGLTFTNIEIGSSAGLTLLWGEYSYRYGQDRAVGPSDSAVRIECDLRGRRPFSPNRSFPQVSNNIGVEIDPVDITDDEAVDWLRALIFPEHADNRILFDQAVTECRNAVPSVIAGDALQVLPNLFTSLADGQPVNVYHSHTLNQFTQLEKDELDALLATESKSRVVTRLAFEGTSGEFSDLRLIRYEGGVRHDDQILANCEAHGRWIDWISDTLEA